MFEGSVAFDLVSLPVAPRIKTVIGRVPYNLEEYMSIDSARVCLC